MEILYAKALQEKNYKVARLLIMDRCKLLGLLVDKTEVKTDNGITFEVHTSLTSDELRTLIDED